MSDFDRCLPIILRLEGGFSDHVADKGGATMNGITQATYDVYRDVIGQPRQPIGTITAAEVEGAYHRLYWEPSGAEYLDWPLSLVVFDASVNHGTARARTMMGAAMFGDVSPQMHAYAMLAIRQFQYQRICQTDPSQKVFLKGWLNRIDKLRGECGI